MTNNQYNPDDTQLLLNNPNIRIVCDCCMKNVTLICHITSQDYDYCVGCFSQLDQFPQTYSIRSSLLYSLTQPEWLCIDQILLLTSFQKWGFGNWGEVKDYMNFNGSKFNKSQIQQHYNQYFLEVEGLNPKVSNDIIQQTKQFNAKQAKRFKILSTKINQKKSIVQIKSEQLLNASKKNPGTQQNILGYNPKRKCFYYDLEYDQKAEVMLADIEFKDDDTPEEMQLKFQIIENYNRRLDQRLKRYEFTIHHHILDIDYRFKQEFSANKYQKEAFLLYRPFTRFQNHTDNLQTMQLIARNNYYKSLIQGLKKCRKKIDKQGRIEQTLEYLNQKQSSVQKLGHPRKVYRVSCEQYDEKMGNQGLKRLQQEIKKNQQSQVSHNLKVIYRSKKD